MGFKEEIEKVEKWFKKTAFVVWISMIGFFGMMGFLFGGAAYFLRLSEAGIKIPSFFLFLFRFFDYACFLFITLVIYYFVFWALRKFYAPYYEKKKVIRDKTQEEKTREIIRDEIKKAGRKK